MTRTGWAGWVSPRVLAVVAAIGVFLAGVATGWWGADRFSPRDAPPLVIVAAPTSGPDGLVAGDRMPDLRGLTETEARQVLHDLGLGQVWVAVDSQPAVAETGTVVAQDPPASAPVGASVALTLAAPAVVPDVVGVAVTDAVRQVEALGAQVHVVRVFEDGVAPDRVLVVEPAAGDPVPSSVVLTVSAPAATIRLAELRPIEGGCRVGSGVQVDGTPYQDALRCDASRAAGRETAYLLNRSLVELSVVVGQPDEATPGSRVRVEILVDETVSHSAVYGWGESEQVSVDLTGALRLVLRVAPVGEVFDRSTAVILADAVLRGGPDGVHELRGS